MSRHAKSATNNVQAETPARRIVDAPPGGEFKFMTPDGREVGKAKNIIEFIRQVKSVPIESVLYHANGNHFSPWLQSIGEKDVATRVSKVRGNGQDVRLQIIRCI